MRLHITGKITYQTYQADDGTYNKVASVNAREIIRLSQSRMMGQDAYEPEGDEHEVQDTRQG